MFKRAKLRDDFLNVFTAFEKYSIVGDERPDNVSEKIYKDPQYDWLVLITNNIQNVRTDWPMSQSDLSNFLTEKYTEQQLVEIHHYETNILEVSVLNRIKANSNKAAIICTVVAVMVILSIVVTGYL